VVLAARARLNAAGERVAGRFTSPLHDERTAALLGVALGVAFGVCFLTGLVSHLLQHPPGWFWWPTRPVWLYRVTQGTHVATGLASVPLLLAKLWTVYPHFWTWPPVRGVAHVAERLSLVPLVGGSLFMLVTGVQNIARWYAWPFHFTAAHYSVAWITMGGLAVHVGAKLHITRRALRSPPSPSPSAPGPVDAMFSRRGFLASVAVGAAAITVATVGQTVRPLRAISVLGPRDPQVGPQGVPVNKSAAGAGVLDVIHDEGYRLVVDGKVDRPLSLSLAELRAMPQREVQLPITCVEGWSATGRWRGVPIGELLRAAGARDGASAQVESLQARSRYRISKLNGRQVADRDTLLALELNGEPLHPDHGYPVRLIAPNRPGVLQTKWLARVRVR
jgi:DMSO/TMAO reductase YedYZ molybdopterin-dependent catalytic subunit